MYHVQEVKAAGVLRETAAAAAAAAAVAGEVIQRTGVCQKMWIQQGTKDQWQILCLSEEVHPGQKQKLPRVLCLSQHQPQSHTRFFHLSTDVGE